MGGKASRILGPSPSQRPACVRQTIILSSLLRAYRRSGIPITGSIPEIRGSNVVLFLVMTYFGLRDYNILPQKELLLSAWVIITHLYGLISRVS